MASMFPPNPLSYAALVQKIQDVADAVQEAERAAQRAGDTEIFAELHRLWAQTGELSKSAMRRGAGVAT